MGGGLVPVLVRGRFADFADPDESRGEKDRHEAPASTPPLPLSLHDEYPFLLTRSSTFIGKKTHYSQRKVNNDTVRPTAAWKIGHCRPGARCRRLELGR